MIGGVLSRFGIDISVYSVHNTLVSFCVSLLTEGISMSKKKSATTDSDPSSQPGPVEVQKKRISTERMVEFVKVWNQSSHVREVSRIMGIPVGTCYVYARRAREAGVGLKELASQASVDWAAVKVAAVVPVAIVPSNPASD
jgi:hypothetical protein